MLLKLLKQLDRAQFEPKVFSLQTKGEVGPQIEALGIPVLSLRMKSGVPNPLKIIELAISLRRIKPDLVQTWMYHADLFGGVAARLAGCKFVVWGLRNSNLDVQLIKRPTLWVVKACAALSTFLPTRILSCSTRAIASHVAIGYQSKKMHMIPNGFDLQRFQPDDEARNSVRFELGLSKEAPLVGLMARYDAQKNHAGFIQAAAMIRQQIPKVHFVLAGGGVDNNNSSLIDLINAYDLGQCTHLLGRRDDMPRLMASLDVLASSSNGEAFPNVIGEAMACGVPCAVTDVGDSAEIVKDTGRVVQSGDMQGLARQIVELLSCTIEQSLALRKQARARVENYYEIGSIAKLYGSSYQKLVQTK